MSAPHVDIQDLKIQITGTAILPIGTFEKIL